MNVPRLTLTEETVRNGVSIIKQCSVKETYPMHCHDFGEMFFVSQGRAMHCVNDRHRLLEKGSLVCIRPDDVHSFSPLNYFDFVMYSIGFPVEEAARAQEYLALGTVCAPELPPHVVLPASSAAETERMMEQLLHTRPDRRLPLFRAMMPLMLHTLLQGDRDDAASPVVPRWLAELEETMRKPENFIAGLPRMLELCPHSQEYLNRMFRLHLKTTPTEYINARRMVYAAERIMEGEMSITDICYASGFNTLSRFYAVFQHIHGCSPTDFRRRMQ